MGYIDTKETIDPDASREWVQDRICVITICFFSPLLGGEDFRQRTRRIRRAVWRRRERGKDYSYGLAPRVSLRLCLSAVSAYNCGLAPQGSLIGICKPIGLGRSTRYR